MRMLALGLWLCSIGVVAAQPKPLAESWDYSAAMKRVAMKFFGRTGVVLHVGDSMTYASPYSAWPRYGKGKTAADQAILRWMHANQDNDTDGLYLARFDHPDGQRSHTAASGLRASELLPGRKHRLPHFDKMLEQYRPQIVLLMLGTNDLSANRPPLEVIADLEKAYLLCLQRGIIPITSTIPPHPGKLAESQQFNDLLRALAQKHALPLIDLEREILSRRPNDWNGTLLLKDDVHLSANANGTTVTDEPTADNLKNSGYLLRGWLSVQKIAEVKRRVIDAIDAKPNPHPQLLSPSQAPTQPRPTPMPQASRDGSDYSLARTRPKTLTPPPGEAVRRPVTRDTWFSNVGSEADGNNGGATRLKLKSHQEMSIVDFDPTPLQGRVVRGAWLHVKNASKDTLHRVTVSSFSAEWVEGTSSDYQPQKGSSSHRWRQHPEVPWAEPGSDLCSVMLGEGGTSWRMTDATEPDANGWQILRVDPLMVGQRIAGISHGFLLYDDTGSEWDRNGENFTLRLFPNRFIYSREAGPKHAPYFTIFLGEADRDAPKPPIRGSLRAERLPSGEADLEWTAQQDVGSAGLVGFEVHVNGKRVPQYLVPAFRPGRSTYSMRLRHLGLAAGAEVTVAIYALDGAGNRSEPLTLTGRVSAYQPRPLPHAMPLSVGEVAALPKLGSAEVAILDELDKVHPINGAMIPPQPAGYREANPLWNARTRQIRLFAAKNEFVAFQVHLHGKITDVRLRWTWQGTPGVEPKVSFGRYALVSTKAGPLPDPIVPLQGGLSIPSPDGPAEMTHGSLHVEIYVPHQTPAGELRGKLTLLSGEAELTLDVLLTVWNFTLPDYLSFLPEMNGYGLPGNDLAYYRLGHAHRTIVNIVPYSHRGVVTEGWGPRWDGQRLDWSAWDAKFGPLLDGSAFADLPRRGVPIDCLYLPIHENWPTPIEPNYNGSYWADQAFPPSYRQALVDISRRFAEHFHEKKWLDTRFQFFLNGKNNFKANGWSRSTSPWILDEPASFQDFWALHWFGKAFHEGVALAKSDARMVYRVDISRPMWQRDSLNGILDYNVVSGAFRPYRRLVLDRKRAYGEILLEYGGTNAVEASNVQPLGWCVDVWCLGGDGVVPWQTIGTARSWKQGEDTCLFYPATPNYPQGPIPSVRLKAYRRGQQDVEYLVLWATTKNEPREFVSEQVRRVLKLSAAREGTGYVGGEDAGILTYRNLKPQTLTQLRWQIGSALDAEKPPPQRRIVDLRTPPRTLSDLSIGLTQ